MRLFLAVWPPPAVVDQIAALPRAEERLRWTTPDQWHVTLRFLGSVPEAEPVAAAFSAAELPSGVIAVAGPTLGRFGSRVLHIPVDGLDALASAVIAATAHLGEPPDPRPFHGHVTLARSRGRGGPVVDLRPLAGVPFSATWPVSEVT